MFILIRKMDVGSLATWQIPNKISIYHKRGGFLYNLFVMRKGNDQGLMRNYLKCQRQTLILSLGNSPCTAATTLDLQIFCEYIA